MYERALKSRLAGSKKSILLLGPRQTGKSTLLSSLRPDLAINLAHEPTYLAFLRDPTELEQRLASTAPRLVLLDEVQRIPSLLNTIQVIIDSGAGPRFLLSGSSARKLKRGHANLLPGRIHGYSLGGLTFWEVGDHFDTMRSLSIGTLPGIYAETDMVDAQKTLSSYTSTYVKEEIQAESLSRNLEGFVRFLSMAAACSGSFLDVTKLAKEAQITRGAAIRYFEILEDTLIVARCDAFSNNSRRRLVQHPRYFFFDPGVLNAIQGNFQVSGDRIGMLFEHLMFSQLRNTAFAHDVELKISSYRTAAGAEIDFIVERANEVYAIECKASRQVSRSDLGGFASFAEIHPRKHRRIVAYLGEEPKQINGIDILPWRMALKAIGF